MARAGVTIKYNPGFSKGVLNSAEVMAQLTATAAEVASAANSMGEGNTAYVSDEARKGRNRAHALVFTGNIRAMVDNARNNTLLKALKARGRG